MMPGNKVLEERMNNLIKGNSKEHEAILESITSINDKLDNAFVTKTRFKPIENIVYGMVGLILIAVFGALIRLVITQIN